MIIQGKKEQHTQKLSESIIQEKYLSHLDAIEKLVTLIMQVY